MGILRGIMIGLKWECVVKRIQVTLIDFYTKDKFINGRSKNNFILIVRIKLTNK